MNRWMLKPVLLFFVMTLIISSCSKNNTDFNYRSYVTEEEHFNDNDMPFPRLNDRLLEDHVLNQVKHVEFTKFKVSKIGFKLSKGNLIPVTSDEGNSILTVYNFYGYHSSNRNDVLLGIYEWENYPNNKKYPLDRFIFRIDFDIPVAVHKAAVSYNSSKIERVPLSLYNKGYIWDIQKDAKNVPSSGAIYIELVGNHSMQSSLFEYRYNSTGNYFNDTKEDSGTMIIENYLNLP